MKIVVRKGETISYATKVFESVALKEALPKFESANINSRGTTELGDTFYRYVKFDFIFLRKKREYICIKEAKFICRSYTKVISDFVRITFTVSYFTYWIIKLPRLKKCHKTNLCIERCDWKN